MARLYSNNYTSTLATAATNSDTTLVVSNATGLPSISGSDYFNLTLAAGGTIEIVKVTAVSGVNLTVVRAQESTSAVAWAVGSIISLRPTASSFSEGVFGPGTTTDNAIVRWGGTDGVTLQNSGVLIDDSDVISGVAGITSTGVIDFGEATSFEVPNGAAPTVDTDGEIAFDTTVADFSTGLLKFYGNEEQGIVSMPIGQFTSPTDGYVVSYNATNDEFELVAQSGGGTPGGSATQIQYNNAGSFGGISTLTFNGTNLTGTGVYDFGGATSFEIPNGAAPTVSAAGQIAVDTTITDYTGMIKYHDGVEELTVLALPTANLSTTDGYVVAYNAANNELEMVAQSGGGTDNEISGFRAYRDGTQSVTLNTHTKVQLTSESYDYDGTFDSTTNYRHTPTTAGKYLYIGLIFFATPADQGQLIAEFYLNGSLATQATAAASGTSGVVVTVVDVITMNGSTDYVELYAYRTNTGNIGATGTYYCQMQGIYIGA